MANIKISELNALTEKADNDLLAIVDTSADETKKIQVSDLLNKNIELIAVTDTAPLECSIGDKYYNTTDKEIYTATATNTWSDTGTTPISGILYIVYNDQASYSWDGTDLVSVGGGKEDIVIDDEEPTDPDVKLWIDTGEVSSSASEITNEYSTSTGLGYSCNFINGVELFKNDSGTTGEVTLSDSCNNYRYMDIVIADSTVVNSTTVRVYKDRYDDRTCLSIISPDASGNTYISNRSITIANNKITTVSDRYSTVNMPLSGTLAVNHTNNINIVRVIGYK